jgi:two-component system OmpR family response regulator
VARGPALLVVDDEPSLRELLAATLRFVGFRVTSAATGAEAVAAAVAEPPDLVLLDVMLPDLDGFEVARRLRGSVPPVDGRPGRLPILFLSARDATADKVRGLTVGGDDYVTKPFELEELVARIRAVLRRTAVEAGGTLVVADLELDPEGHRVLRAGRPVPLSPTELRLLHYLMLNAGRVLAKAQIVAHVWDYDFGGDHSIVESYVSYLRRKVDAVEPKLIHTVRGAGYVLRAPQR